MTAPAAHSQEHDTHIKKPMASFITKQDIERMFADIGFPGLTEAERSEMLPKLLDHMNEVAMRTVLQNMSGEQLAQFEAATDDALGGEQKIQDIVADIPGLQRKIEEAVAEEAATMREARKLLP